MVFSKIEDAINDIKRGKFVIVVDDDIDPSDPNDVIWAVATRCEPAESIDIIKGFASASLDPRISPDMKEQGQFTNSRAILYACKPFEWFSKFPQVNRASEELRQKTAKKFAHILDNISKPK